MLQKRENVVAKAKADSDELIAPHASHGIARATNVLALMLVKDMKQVDAIDMLSRAGYKPMEIAGLLGTSSNSVSVAIYQSKSKRKPKKGGRG